MRNDNRSSENSLSPIPRRCTQKWLPLSWKCEQCTWLSRLQRSQVGAPVIGDKFVVSQECNHVYIIIRCKGKWQNEGQRCWAIKYIEKQQRQPKHFTYNVSLWKSLYLLFVLWFLLWCLWFSPGRRFSLCWMPWPKWQWMSIIWCDGSLEGITRN